MAHTDLPRPLDSYFAFAEIASNRQGRRFTITFTYFEGQRLDRLQWWWQVSTAQERIGGDAGIEALRREAVERFRLHIERWLETSRKRLYDGNPFPRLEALVEQAAPVEPAVPAASCVQGSDEPAVTPATAPEVPPAESRVLPWPVEKVANG